MAFKNSHSNCNRRLTGRCHQSRCKSQTQLSLNLRWSNNSIRDVVNLTCSYLSLSLLNHLCSSLNQVSTNRRQASFSCRTQVTTPSVATVRSPTNPSPSAVVQARLESSQTRPTAVKHRSAPTPAQWHLVLCQSTSTRVPTCPNSCST